MTMGKWGVGAETWLMRNQAKEGVRSTPQSPAVPKKVRQENGEKLIATVEKDFKKVFDPQKN
jgi:hypothetical protein